MVGKALAMLRETSGVNLTVGALALHAAVSRRLLETKFREHLGRSPHQEILRVRIDYARELLMRTDWSVIRIAEQAGFVELRSFNIAFRGETGQNPRSYWTNCSGTSRKARGSPWRPWKRP